MPAPDKDVDCFHPFNVGQMSIGAPTFLPCTPAGVMEMLRAYEIPVAGKRCVVLGRSNIVGKPMAMLLTQADGTVTVCHSRTPDLAALTREADILVAAVGRVGLVTADMVRPGAVVIDVAMNRNADGKLCGDVVFDEVEAKASYITPVPGRRGAHDPGHADAQYSDGCPEPRSLSRGKAGHSGIPIYGLRRRTSCPPPCFFIKSSGVDKGCCAEYDRAMRNGHVGRCKDAGAYVDPDRIASVCGWVWDTLDDDGSIRMCGFLMV